MTPPYDPTLYLGAAAYYTPGRPPYSRELAATLATEAGLDGAGRLLDVGCGPGSLTHALADRFDEAIGLDPDAQMLAEGARRGGRIRWVQGRAEEIAALDLGTFRLVTFGQSFHWTDRERVAEMVYDALEPGGALALVTHEHEERPKPEGPGHPPIPHDAIRALLARYLGPHRRAGQGLASLPADRSEHAGAHPVRDPAPGLLSGPPRHRPGLRRGARQLSLDLVRRAAPVRGPAGALRSRPARAASRTLRGRPLLGLAGRHADPDRAQRRLQSFPQSLKNAPAIPLRSASQGVRDGFVRRKNSRRH